MSFRQNSKRAHVTLRTPHLSKKEVNRNQPIRVRSVPAKEQPFGTSKVWNRRIPAL